MNDPMRHWSEFSATHGWLYSLRVLTEFGSEASPRDMLTLEKLGFATSFDMRYPVLYCPPRSPSYGFMAAEALWILRGDDRVEPLAKHAPSISRFSDDGGATLSGAYGPRWLPQTARVVHALLRDGDTRQAVAVLWRQDESLDSKDVPCTVYLNFAIRHGRLHAFVRMRSSDAWLGLPYDWFSFTSMAFQVACLYNEALIARDFHEPGTRPVRLGTLHWSADSFHLYQRDWDRAAAVIRWMDDHTTGSGCLVRGNLPTHHTELADDRAVNGTLGFSSFVRALTETAEGTPASGGWRIEPPATRRSADV